MSPRSSFCLSIALGTTTPRHWPTTSMDGFTSMALSTPTATSLEQPHQWTITLSLLRRYTTMQSSDSLLYSRQLAFNSRVVQTSLLVGQGPHASCIVRTTYRAVLRTTSLRICLFSRRAAPAAHNAESRLGVRVRQRSRKGVRSFVNRLCI